MIWGSGGSKSRLAKAAGAEPAGQMRDEKLQAVVARSTFRSQNVQNTSAPDHVWKLRCRKKCTPLWREAHFEVKMLKTPGFRTTFGSWDVEKVHAVVARSTFPSQNVQSTSASDHFWKLICWKSARRCGAKHISKSKCTKHVILGPLLEVDMLKKCTPLWREWHFEVKMFKTLGVRTTFAGSDVVSRGRGARDRGSCQKCAKHDGFTAFRQKMAGMGHLQMICKDAFSAAGAGQKTCSWERLGDQGADFLRGVTFWSIRSVGLLRGFHAAAVL